MLSGAVLLQSYACVVRTGIGVNAMCAAMRDQCVLLLLLVCALALVCWCAPVVCAELRTLAVCVR